MVDGQEMNNKAQDKIPKKHPKIGVVVGSGGIKAISSIPLFEFLEKAKIFSSSNNSGSTKSPSKFR